MQITQVDLDNVKSYRRASVTFTEGTNAICGPNGAGKSTLLESIGFALFDVLPYSQSQFVREGEKTATVTVHIVGKDDRIYQVMRQCGSRSQYYIYDPEIDQKLATSKRDTVDWLHEFLGLDESGDLSAVFRDAVGVPQGLLTSAFLLTATNRKNTFDPLLRVDEYKRVWDALLEPRRHLERRITDEEKRIAGFEAEVKALPDWQNKATELQAKVHADEQLLEGKRAELKDVTRRKEQLDAVKERLDALDKSVTQADGEVKALGAQLKASQDAVETAEDAQSVVDDTKAGHQAYLTAQTNLEMLEDQRTERDGLREAQEKHKTDLALAKQQVKGLESQLADIQSAEAEIERLRPQVETQERLENQLIGAQRAADRLDDAERNLAQEQERLIGLEAKLVEVREGLEELVKVEGELESLQRELEALERQLETLRSQIVGHQAELDHVGEQAALAAGRVVDAEQVLSREQLRLNNLHASVYDMQTALEELTSTDQQIGELRPELDDLEMRHEDLTSRSAQRQAELDQVGAQTAILETSETALCPVCDRPLTPERRAELLARNQARWLELDTALARTRSEQDEVRKARQQKRNRLGELEQRAKELPRPGEVGTFLSQIEVQERVVVQNKATLSAERAEASAYEKRRAEAEVALDELQPRRDEVGKVRSHKLLTIGQLEQRRRELPRPAEAGELSAQIVTQREKMGESETLVGELADAPAEVERLAAELAALGDPRREYQRSADAAGRRNEVEEVLAATREQINQLNGQISALDQDLMAYTELDKHVEIERQALEVQEAYYLRYLEHIREAETLADRLGKFETLTRELDAAQHKWSRLTGERDKIATGYDAETYLALVDSYQALRDEFATLEERLRLQRGQLQEARNEIKHLTGIQKKLQSAQDERQDLGETLAVLGYIRQVLRDAGPKVTKALVEIISLQAARLYADIMADHTARLQWTEDYEILLTTSGRERTFQQLSGGEQMTSALAVRLALLREVSDIDIAFFDEPTANLDDQRRDSLAEQILNVKGFSQLFVISHDDTFERDTDHVVRVVKENGVSRVEV
jgi:exonuclease SbcC